MDKWHIEDSKVFCERKRRQDSFGRAVRSNKFSLDDTLIGVDETAKTNHVSRLSATVKELSRIRYTMKVEAVVVETKEEYKKGHAGDRDSESKRGIGRIRDKKRNREG